MATNAHEVYASAVRHLPPRERLRLAALILDELAHSTDALDISDEWTAQDEKDLTAFSLTHAAREYAGEDDDKLL